MIMTKTNETNIYMTGAKLEIYI